MVIVLLLAAAAALSSTGTFYTTFIVSPDVQPEQALVVPIPWLLQPEKMTVV